MATKIEFPTAGTPSVPTDYTKQNEYLEGNARGYNGVSLTNWDSGFVAPLVSLGSVLEANGVFWESPINESIDESGASDGLIYVYLDDVTETYKGSNTFPTWSESKNGWYIGAFRFTGHRYYRDGTTYSSKHTMEGRRRLHIVGRDGQEYQYGFTASAVYINDGPGVQESEQIPLNDTTEIDIGKAIVNCDGTIRWQMVFTGAINREKTYRIRDEADDSILASAVNTGNNHTFTADILTAAGKTYIMSVEATSTAIAETINVSINFGAGRPVYAYSLAP